MTPVVLRLVPLAWVVLLAAPPVGAAPLELVATGQFRVYAKGSVVPEARVYRTIDPPAAFLLETPLFDRPVYVTTAPRSARLIDPARCTPDVQDKDVLRLDVSGPQEAFFAVHVEGPRLVMERDGVTLALAPSPPVLGDRTLGELLAQLPEYRRGAARYTPDRRALDTLRAVGEPTEILVFFGSWCPHCERAVPRLIRVLEDIATAPITATFHGVPPESDLPDPEAERYGVTALPLAVIRRHGQELARLSGDHWETPERRLAAVLGPTAR